MADFKLFEPLLLQQEGGWCNKAADSGGETWEGISRKNYPKWPGWPLVDHIKASMAFPASGWTRDQVKALDHALRQSDPLDALVDQFYKCSEWDLLRGDDIHNQSIANFLVDWEVNCGEGSPLFAVQDLAGISPHVLNMGPLTLGWLNGNCTADTFAKLQAARAQHYHNIVAARPEDKEFLDGWLERNASFKYTA